MADQLIEKLRDLTEGQIDFEGQRFAELLATVFLAIVAAISFFVGIVSQDIKLALYIGLGGTALTFLAVVPPWPFFNQHPVNWLPVEGKQSAAQQAGLTQGITVDGKAVA